MPFLEARFAPHCMRFLLERFLYVRFHCTYNEYMALHHCIKQIVWLRQLFHEIGLADYISKPTLVHADNKQANQLCSEDLVTQGNMYFRTGYHYCKEAVRDMYCTVQYVDTALNIIHIGFCRQ